jgi:hypothetical protein
MEAVWTSETLVNSYQSTWRYNQEDSHLQPSAYYLPWESEISLIIFYFCSSVHTCITPLSLMVNLVRITAFPPEKVNNLVETQLRLPVKGQSLILDHIKLNSKMNFSVWHLENQHFTKKFIFYLKCVNLNAINSIRYKTYDRLLLQYGSQWSIPEYLMMSILHFHTPAQTYSYINTCWKCLHQVQEIFHITLT